MTAPRPTVRCAVYARKSSDDGLEQEFNSLDCQRQSAEQFIASHAGEGWTCLPSRYDDGGFSGGSMERPSLRQLLSDVEAGRVDAIVIYKLDRLTRSIRDFGRIMELLEQHSVALVVVTQPINTGTSMGRLMVHILMSFAQFERELASERTRDKIALSRQRGQWTGGRPVLGYDYAGCKLTVNHDEVSVVRAIFDLYLERGTLRGVLAALAEQGITNKVWTTRDGRTMGGQPLSLSRLAGLLANPLYIGKVPHRSKLYDGVHAGIIDPAVFHRVQELLAENARSGGTLRRNLHGGLLKGLLRCGCCGAAMIHSTSGGKGKPLHRYYRCGTAMLRGRGACRATSGAKKRSSAVPAEAIEAFVIDKALGGLREQGGGLVTVVLDVARAEAEEQLRTLEARRTLVVAGLTGDGASSPSERAALQQRADEVQAEMIRARAAVPSRADVEAGLKDFSGLWCTLSPAERARLLKLVIARVVYDPVGSSISIELNSLTGDQAPQGAAA